MCSVRILASNQRETSRNEKALTLKFLGYWKYRRLLTYLYTLYSECFGDNYIIPRQRNSDNHKMSTYGTESASEDRNSTNQNYRRRV